MSSEDDVHLYDRVAAIQERLGSEELEQLRPKLEGEDGEGRFTELVQERVGPDDVVVDIGTGAGVWLLGAVAPNVGRVVGLDYARGRYRFALQARTELGVTNADFLLADGRHIPLRSGIADVVTNRRGPWSADEHFFAEGCRVLARGGLGLEIHIGELNGQELEDVFGERCQMHEWLANGRDPIDDLVALYRRHGLEPLATESYVATEVFPSREALVYRLDTSPALDGFDAEADATLVERVIAEHGLRLTTHRICLVARKTR